MDDEESRFLAMTPIMVSNEARDQLHAIMTNDMAEAIDQIGQTLEACNTKKSRLLDQLDGVFRAVEAVRNECGCIDTTIASKVLHLNKLVTQIVQQIARVNIPDPPPPPTPVPAPVVEIDLIPIHDRLNNLDQTINNLTKLILEKDETLLYVINKRPGHAGFATNVQAPVQLGDSRHDQGVHIQTEMAKLQTLVQNWQNEGDNHSKQLEQHRIHHYRRRHHQARSSSHEIPLLDEGDEEQTSQTNGEQHDDHISEDNDETSGDSDQTTVGPCLPCVQERTEELTSKRSNGHRSIASSYYTDRSQSQPTRSVEGGSNSARRLGEALASNGNEFIYYDYEQQMVCVSGIQEYRIKFHHGLVVDLYWWAVNTEWLILSEQGLYRWKANEDDYHIAYEFANGEIGFRRIAVTDSSIYCLFRYSLMLLELSNSMQMKRLHALSPHETGYRKLADISVRKMTRPDDTEEDVLGLIWFGVGEGILLEDRYVTSHANNMHDRLFRYVAVQKGSHARLASYEDGRSWLISNIGADMFLIVDNATIAAGRWDAKASWINVSTGVPVNAVGFTNQNICLRLQNGKIEYLESEEH